MKKLLGILGLLVLLFILGTGVTVAAALFGKAPQCPLTNAVKVRSENELIRQIETKGLVLTDAEATGLVSKSLSAKIIDPRVCFTKDFVHLSGKLKLGRISPSFYVSTGVDLTGPTPKAKNLDIRLGSLPNFFIFTPVEKMIEGIINDNLAKAQFEEKFAIEFKEASATIKKIK